eukprot:scaffold1307_cov151-Amphora_coffeaeformis.AAC.6
MATARNVQQGPAGTISAMMGAAAERVMASQFVALLEDASPSFGVRAELNVALEELAAIPVNVHALLVAEGVENYDAIETHGMGEEESRLIMYATATLVPRLV